MMESQLKGDVTWISSMTMNTELGDQDIQNAEEFSLTDVLRVSWEQLRYDQRGDRDDGRVVAYKMKAKRSTKLQRIGETEGTRVLVREWNRIKLGENHILQRRKGDKPQLVLAQKYRRVVLKQLHREMGH